MAIDKLSFGLGAGYDPPFAVDEVDVNRIKLRSKETAPLTHNTLDENFANLSLKINALIDTNVGNITLNNVAPEGQAEHWVVNANNLGINNGTGISYTSTTGIISHQAKPATAAGYTETNNFSGIITGINVDSLGHFVGYKSDTTLINPSFGTIEARSADVYAMSLIREYDVMPENAAAASKIQGGAIANGAVSHGAALGFVLGDANNPQDVTETYGYLYFDTKNSGGGLTEKMRIDSEGNVGIGTISPDYKLDISTNNTTGLRLINPDSSGENVSNDPPAILFQGQGWDTNAGSRAYSARIRVNSNYSEAAGRGNTHPVMNFDLETNENDPDDTLSTKMMINADGNVGIGTTSPLHKLHIADGNNGDMSVGGSHDICGLQFSYDQATATVSTIRANTNYANVATLLKISTNNNTDQLVLKGDGNVGIGTTNPKHALQVEGGNIQCNQQIRATGWFTGDLPSAGPATEIGYSWNSGWIMAYDRANSEYKPLTLQAGSVTLRLNPTSGILEHSIDGGNNYSNLAHDSRSVAANDWIVGYGSTDHERLAYDSSKKQCSLIGGLVPGRTGGNYPTDTSIGCYYKAKRVEPTVSHYRVTVRAMAENESHSTGFYIGCIWTDDEDLSGYTGDNPNTHVIFDGNGSAGHAENEEAPADTFADNQSWLSDMDGRWLRNNGSINNWLETYTYMVEVPAGKKWFSVVLLNWDNMGADTLIFDPLIDIEPVNPTFTYDSATGTLNITTPTIT